MIVTAFRAAPTWLRAVDLLDRQNTPKPESNLMRYFKLFAIFLCNVRVNQFGVGCKAVRSLLILKNESVANKPLRVHGNKKEDMNRRRRLF